MNRNLSIRKNPMPARRRFSLATLRGLQQPGLSKKMNRLVKTENNVISAHERAGRERVSVAAQLSEWGESTDDDAVSDIADKLGVLLAEMGEQEDVFAQNLEDYRTLLKHIRDTEASVQPSRDYRARVADDIQKQKIKDASSPKVETLEQELVRAEAQNLVAEAQLTNMTRQKMKEAYDVHLAGVIERGEKQILLARHARRLLNLLDDTPIVPGDSRAEYMRAAEAKMLLEEAEKDLMNWQSSVEPIQTSASDVPANTLLPAPARKGRRVRTSSSDAGVAPDERTDLSDSIRDVNGSNTDTQDYESVAAEPNRVYEEYSAAPVETDGYAAGTTCGNVGGFSKVVPSRVVPDESRYVGGRVTDTTSARAAQAIPDESRFMDESVNDTMRAPEGANGVTDTSEYVDASSAPIGATRGYTAPIVDSIAPPDTSLPATQDINSAGTDADGMYGATTGATSAVDGSASDARDFTTEARDFSDNAPAMQQSTTIGSSSLDAAPPTTGSRGMYGATADTASGMDGTTSEADDLYRATDKTVQGMDHASVGSRSGAAAGGSGSAPGTQGYSRSTVDAMTNTDNVAPPEQRSAPQAGYTAGDWGESSAMSKGQRQDYSDSGAGMEDSGFVDAIDAIDAREGNETRNVEESVTRFASEEDGEVTSRMKQETVVTRNPPPIDGAQATREKLQSQPHMLGGFGLQTIGVPY